MSKSSLLDLLKDGDADDDTWTKILELILLFFSVGEGNDDIFSYIFETISFEKCDDGEVNIVIISSFAESMTLCTRFCISCGSLIVFKNSGSSIPCSISLILCSYGMAFSHIVLKMYCCCSTTSFCLLCITMVKSCSSFNTVVPINSDSLIAIPPLNPS